MKGNLFNIQQFLKKINLLLISRKIPIVFKEYLNKQIQVKYEPNEIQIIEEVIHLQFYFNNK